MHLEIDEEDTLILTHQTHMISILLLKPLFDCKFGFLIEIFTTTHYFEYVILSIKNIMEYTAVRRIKLILDSGLDLNEYIRCHLDSFFHITFVYYGNLRIIEVEYVSIIGCVT